MQKIIFLAFRGAALAALVLAITVFGCSSSNEKFNYADDDNELIADDEAVAEDDESAAEDAEQEDEIIPEGDEVSDEAAGEDEPDAEDDMDAEPDETDEQCVCSAHCLTSSQYALGFGAVLPPDSKAMTITISSTGNDLLVVYNIRVNNEVADQFLITMNPAEGGTLILGPRQSADVEVTYKPKTSEPLTGNLIISSSDECSPNTIVSLASGVKGNALLEVSPVKIEFKDKKIAQLPLFEPFTITAKPEQPDDTRPLKVTGIYLSDDTSIAFLLDPRNAENGCEPPFTLEPNKSMVCKVRFLTEAIGTYAGKIIVKATDEKKPEQSAEVELAGQVVNAALEADPKRVDFGYVITNTKHQRTVKLTNTGTGALDITQIALVVDDSPFSLEGGAAETLGPLQSKYVTVKYQSPNDGVVDLNTILVINTGEGGLTQVMLSGMSYQVCPYGFEEDVQNGVCIPRCTPGDKFCAGDGFRVCMEDGQSLSDIIPCGDGTYCDNGECIQQICAPGTQQCNAEFTEVMRCNEIGSALQTFIYCKSGGLQCRDTKCVQDGLAAYCKTDLLSGVECDDRDYCTVDTLCKEGLCMGNRRNCSDANECTDDSCDQEGQTCVHKASAKNSICNDGNICTVNDYCDGNGSCAGGAIKDCDDNNRCTDDYCDPQVGCVHLPVLNRICDDGNPCTTSDYCDATGKCVGGTASSCDDKNPCTLDSCGLYGCVHTPLSQGNCEDDNPCTVNDKCFNGVCIAGTGVVCDDHDSCTFDHCVATEGGCIYEPVIGALCEDGDACTTGDKCVQQTGKVACVGTAKSCDTGNLCVSSSCDSSVGCTYVNLDGKICDDGNPCTTGDKCMGGYCVPGSGTDCRDANPCTKDSCNAQGDCTHTPLNQGTACEDGNPCTVNDKCDANGNCIAGSNPGCDDGNPCTQDVCDAVVGCKNIPQNGTPCDDGDVCTTVDACYNGACRGGSVDPCGDDNDCTTDYCQAKVGCQHINRSGSCNDGNACTTGDSCGYAGGASWRCVGTAVNPATYCDDGNPCTTDTCDAGSGCAHTQTLGASCSDGNACTNEDKCVAAAGGGIECKGTAIDEAAVCNDTNECTFDYCDPTYGCRHTNKSSGTSCNDKNACTGTANVPDSCQAGECKGGETVVCDDKNVCTDDACNTSTGCVFTPAANRDCDDGDPCSLGDKCDAAGKCVSGTTTRNCSTGNPCMNSWCDAKDYRADTFGCVSVGLPNKTACDKDNDPCTIDECTSYNCLFVSNRSCDDGNECTENYCSKIDPLANPVTGCVLKNELNTKACIDDGNACTYDFCNGNGQCGHTNKPTTESCSDNKYCTINDHCDGGGFCVTGGNRDCSGQCYVGTCNESAKKCDWKSNYTTCNDGNASTIEDVCMDGSCYGSQNWATAGDCPDWPDMVKIVGTDYCIDKYEGSLWETSSCSGAQYGVSADDYPAGFSDKVGDGGEAQTTPVYACSLPGSTPSANMSYWQAKKACENSGKILCPSSTWQTACQHGQSWAYPYGNTFTSGTCNTLEVNLGHAAACGLYASCKSDWGAFDLSGNVREWTQSNSCQYDNKKRGAYGGNFSTDKNSSRCDSRVCGDADASGPATGVRCCIQY